MNPNTFNEMSSGYFATIYAEGSTYIEWSGILIFAFLSLIATAFWLYSLRDHIECSRSGIASAIFVCSLIGTCVSFVFTCGLIGLFDLDRVVCHEFFGNRDKQYNETHLQEYKTNLRTCLESCEISLSSAEFSRESRFYRDTSEFYNFSSPEDMKYIEPVDGDGASLHQSEFAEAHLLSYTKEEEKYFVFVKISSNGKAGIYKMPLSVLIARLTFQRLDAGASSSHRLSLKQQFVNSKG